MTDIFKNKPKIIMPVAAGIILRYNDNLKCDEVLIIERSSKDHYPFFHETPRGKCDKGKNEPLRHCLKREVKEETGLDVRIVKFIDKFSYLADKGTRESIQHNYLCEMINPNQPVKLSKEHDSFMWVTSMGLVNLHVMPEIAKSIAKVFNKEDAIYSAPGHTTIKEYLDFLQKE